MTARKGIVIVGGVAAGASAACRMLQQEGFDCRSLSGCSMLCKMWTAAGSVGPEVEVWVPIPG
jgi:hypothetical protein